jgi:hypothetical protein
MTPRNVFMPLESLAVGNGGICRVARSLSATGSDYALGGSGFIGQAFSGDE